MTELWVSGGVLLTLMFGSFGVFWKIITDVKKSSHSRMDRIETSMGDMKTDCNNRLATYVNKDDLNRVEKAVSDGFSSMSGRIDSLLLAFSNGIKKRK